VFAIDAAGNVVSDLQDPEARFAQTTGAFEHAGALYVTSLSERTLGRLAGPLPLLSAADAAER
jgi:hypothetical protein